MEVECSFFMQHLLNAAEIARCSVEYKPPFSENSESGWSVLINGVPVFDQVDRIQCTARVNLWQLVCTPLLSCLRYRCEHGTHYFLVESPLKDYPNGVLVFSFRDSAEIDTFMTVQRISQRCKQAAVAA